MKLGGLALCQEGLTPCPGPERLLSAQTGPILPEQPLLPAKEYQHHTPPACGHLTLHPGWRHPWNLHSECGWVGAWELDGRRKKRRGLCPGTGEGLEIELLFSQESVWVRTSYLPGETGAGRGCFIFPGFLTSCSESVGPFLRPAH